MRERAILGGTTGFFNRPTFAEKVLQRNQGDHVKALETRICTRQTRGLAKIRVVRKSNHCRGYSNPASGENLTNTRQLGKTSSSENSEGTLSQQFAQVLTQSALRFPEKITKACYRIFFLTPTAWQPMVEKIKHQGTKNTAPSTSRLADL